MRRSNWLLVVAVILLSAATASANSINDPQIIVRDANPGVLILNNPVVSINLNGQTGCAVSSIPNPFGGTGNVFDVVCNVFVPGGVTLSSLTFFVSPLQTPLSGLVFDNLFSTVFVDPNNQFVTFSGGNIVGAFDMEFEFIGFASNTTVTVVSNAPEPATLALFLTGIGALVTRRKLLARS
ncbi:MAG: PEP-CTERM sorting domain-containing protein [Acidobacteria bacterium]|nr:PEP-CTERM sorting domain-containing protein [Acidobacteriota bacterium]